VAADWQAGDGSTDGYVAGTCGADRNYVNVFVWKPALQQAGVLATRENGMHALRHYFASVLLEDGVSIKALAEYLEHADPGFTLRTYTHLMPASEDRMRKVVDRALAATVDGPSRALNVPSGAAEMHRRRSAAHMSRCRSRARTRTAWLATVGCGRSPPLTCSYAVDSS
jgi:hypothetical protein